MNREHFVEWRGSAQARAKINLTLDLAGQDERGYHILQSVFHETDCLDTLFLSLESVSSLSSQVCVHWPEAWQAPVRLEVSGLLSELPENNTLRRSLEVFRQHLSVEQRLWFQDKALVIRLTKQIPSEAGLGGGSADAAACLKLLQELYGFPYSEEQLLDLAEQVGMDVPFCLMGGCAYLQGSGRQLTPISPWKDQVILLAKLPLGLSTAQAFAALDRMNAQWSSSSGDCRPWRQEEWGPWKPQTERFLSGNASGVREWEATGNLFEAILPQLRPEVEALLFFLRKQDGCLQAHLSGSGTACWAALESQSRCLQVEEALHQAFPDIWTHSGVLVSDENPISRKECSRARRPN